MYTLHYQQDVKKDIGEVFAFFEKPENLSALTPPSLGFSILTPPPLVMRAGLMIDYTIKLSGLPLRWTTCIADYDPPHQFIDLQLRGPYSYWHHTHRFSKLPEGTRIEDTVRYVLPFGILGRVAHALFVRRQLEQIFSFRREIIAELFGSAGGERVVFDFNEADCAQWRAINDAVMGGVSRGILRFEGESVAVFTGCISFENQGGFASVKSAAGHYDFSSSAGFRLRVFGDGKRYKLRIKTTDLRDDIFYESPFQTASGRWETVTLPCSSFYAIWRGTRVPDAPPLNPGRIVSFGLLISDRQEGPFELKIDRIEAVADC